jgi:hypothetical protein
MKKKKFGEVLRKLVGGIREKKITTYDESGEIIEVATITTRLSVLTIIYKLFLELMIVVISISILSKLYFFIFQYNYSLDPARTHIYSFFFNPFGDILFLWLFIWLRSKIDDDGDEDVVHMAIDDDDDNDVVHMASPKDKQ